MSFQISNGRLTELIVFADIGGHVSPVGKLVFEGARRQFSRFSYASSWLKNPKKIPIAPIGLPFRKNWIESAPHEIHLPFADTAPDGWGRMVLQRAFPDQHFGMGECLAASGDNRTGWLRYGSDPALGPEQWAPDANDLAITNAVDIPALLAAAEAMERGSPAQSDLMLLYRSSDIGGARPKARIQHEGREWIAKFPSLDDAIEEPRIEAACLALAKAAGITVPDFRFEEIAGKPVLLVERFDRNALGHRLGYISVGTLLGVNANTYSTDFSYLDIANEAQSAGISPCFEEMFRRLAFNVAINNTDDHLRNHGFIGDPSGWHLSPAFDMVPQKQRGLVLRPAPGQSKCASLEDIFSIAQKFGVTNERLDEIKEIMSAAFAGITDHLDEFKIRRDQQGVLENIMPEAFKLATGSIYPGHSPKP